jgi:hypothetical protein
MSSDSSSSSSDEGDGHPEATWDWLPNRSASSSLAWQVFQVRVTPATRDQPQIVDKSCTRCSLCKKCMKSGGNQTQTMLRHIKRKHKNTDVGRALLKTDSKRAENVAVAKRAIEATVDDPSLVHGALKEAKSRKLQQQLTAFSAAPEATAPPSALPYGDISPQQQRHDLLVMVDISCGFKSFAVRLCVRRPCLSSCVLCCSPSRPAAHACVERGRTLIARSAAPSQPTADIAQL